jgi:hypothetical protein
MRFVTYNTMPPGGVFFFQLGADYVSAPSRIQICAKVKALHLKHGVPCHPDPWEMIMDHMCQRLPSGYCTEPVENGVKMYTVADIKANTQKLFGKMVADPASIRDRLSVCVGCKLNKRSLCPTCTGLLPWILSGSKRAKVSADDFVSVCAADAVFISALVSVEQEGKAPETCSDNCWRRHG